MRLSPGMLITMKGSTVQWEVLPEAKWSPERPSDATAVCVTPGAWEFPDGTNVRWYSGDLSYFPADFENLDFEVDSFESWVSQVRKEAGIVDE